MNKLPESMRDKHTTTRDRRTITLGVRVSPEERAAIERAAAREYRRVSDYIRVLVLKTLQDEIAQDEDAKKEANHDSERKQKPAR